VRVQIRKIFGACGKAAPQSGLEKSNSLQTMNSTDETWVFKHPLSADDEYRLRRAGKDVGALLPEEGCSVEENQTRLK
jgi:hypothetical protein